MAKQTTQRQKHGKKIVFEYNALYPVSVCVSVFVYLCVLIYVSRLFQTRALKSLREKYDGTKRAIPKQKADEKFSRMATGGGPPPMQPKPLSATLARLADVIFMSVEGMPERIGDEDFEEVGTSTQTIYFDGSSILTEGNNEPNSATDIFEIVTTKNVGIV